MVIYKSDTRTINWVTPKAAKARSMLFEHLWHEGAIVAYMFEDKRRLAVIYFKDGYPLCVGKPQYIVRSERDYQFLPKKAVAQGRSKENLLKEVCYIVKEQ